MGSSLGSASVVRTADPGPGLGGTVAVVEGAACFGQLRVARLAATEDMADEPLGTGGLVLAAAGDTPHPGLTRAMWDVIHEASPLPGAGRPLAVLPVEPRAHRGAFSGPHAALLLGACAAFTRGETGRTMGSLVAEEALGTARGFLQPAGTATPALADESLLAALARRLRQGVAGLALLSQPHQRAQAKGGALAPECHSAAGEPPRAL